MDEVPILGVSETKDAFKTFQAMYGPPAYIRRAREVEAALERLLDRCRRQRDEWLAMVGLRLGVLSGLAGEWPALAPLLDGADELGRLERLERDLAPSLRVPVAPTTSRRRLRRALLELAESIARFNRRWEAYLRAVDLGPLNELRDGYNRHYVLEKECAVRSPRLAREGFVRLEPFTTADLFALLPPLPVPFLAG